MYIVLDIFLKPLHAFLLLVFEVEINDFKQENGKVDVDQRLNQIDIGCIL